MDVIDAEYTILLHDIYNTHDFQAVLKIQKQFLSNVLRLSHINNIAIQENIERILQICLRFIAICRILHNVEINNSNSEDYDINHESNKKNNSSKYNNTNNNYSGNNNSGNAKMSSLPIYIPPEEFIFIKKDFFQQISLLLHMMKKVDSRGFLFRLDFNGFLSSATI